MILDANEYRRVDASSPQCGYYSRPPVVCRSRSCVRTRKFKNNGVCAPIYITQGTILLQHNRAKWRPRRRRRRLFIVPAMVANSSCATDLQAHLPMLYYACYIRGSVVAAVALMPIHTATPRRDASRETTPVQIFARDQRVDNAIARASMPIDFNGASGSTKRIFDVPARS